jgi:hypothetical protein
VAKEYVAYTQLGEGCPPGTVVNPANWDLEQWKYMVDHQVVVPKNSQNDPNVLAEAAAEQRDTIAEQSAQNDQPAQLSEAEKAHKAALAGQSSSDEDEEPDPERKTATSEPKEPAPDANKPKAADGTAGTNRPAPTPAQSTPPPSPAAKAAEQKKA